MNVEVKVGGRLLELDDRYLKTKFKELISKLKEKESVLVALSGGVDSSVVAKAAKISLGDKAVAVTADSATLPQGELEEAGKIAREIGIKHIVTKVDELRNLDFTRNTKERCYYCKKELIAELKKLALREGLKNIVDGTNADDLKTYRPGIKALKEEGVHSPLAEVGLTKNEVKMLAKAMNLPTANKPPMACLASRIPYGSEITDKKLRRIDQAEAAVISIVKVKQLRIRDHGNIARIEVGSDERKMFFDEKIMDRIAEKLRSIGFTYVAFDLEGYRQGSMDEDVSK